MFRRLSAVSLLCAWLCASGALLDLAQAFAWARMFAGYARTASVVAAVRRTLDPERPCAICRAVGRAREASGARGPAVAPAGAQKMTLVLESPAPLVAAVPEEGWPAAAPERGPARAAEVPVPPPRARLA